MLKESFSKLTRHSQAWILAMIAGWDDFDKIASLILKYVGTPKYFKLIQEDVDTFFIAQFSEMNIVSFCGTKNTAAWISDFSAFTINGRFHPSIFEDVEKQFFPHVDWFENKDLYTMVTGQSKGGADAVIANYLLSISGFSDSESWNFSGPFVTTEKGIIDMKNHGVRNTNFNTDPFSSLPSDPTDDVGVFRGRHYGENHQLYGSGGPTDHGYHQITLHLAVWLRANGFTDDALYMLDLARCRDLIKK